MPGRKLKASDVGHSKKKSCSQVKHKTSKNHSNMKNIKIKISGKGVSSQRKIVPNDDEDKKPFRPTTVRSLERREKKDASKKRRGLK